MKTTVVIAFILASLPAYTLVQGDNPQDEVKITVTADRKTTFDMFDSRGGILKGLTTPYELKFSRTDSKFIFKAQKSKARLLIKVEVNNKAALTADWPITVVEISKNSMSTFGM